MAHFSKVSKAGLSTCHPDIQLTFNVVVKYFDCKVLYGGRQPDNQFALYKKGREEINGKWVVTAKAEVVTYCDGFKKLSDHNYRPSRAADVVPYPVDYKNIRRQIYFAGYVLGVARILKRANKIRHEIRWGGDWNDDTFIKDTRFLDFPHFYIYI